MSLPLSMRSSLDPFRSTMRKHGHSSSSRMVMTMSMKMDGISRSSFGGNGTRALRKCGGVMDRRCGRIWAELPEKEKDSAEESSSTAKVGNFFSFKLLCGKRVCDF